MNRDHIFGKYPDNTVNEIWNGKSIVKLRELMVKSDLSSGCQICKHQLLNKNFDAIHAYYYDLLPVMNNSPTSMEFELSNICNLECIMCTSEFSSKHDKQNEFKHFYDDEFVNQLDMFIPSIKQARFFGGEPFLIMTYFDIWAKIIRLNPSCAITVQTNATILNDKIKQLLDKGFFNIGISFESLQKDCYETIRKGANFEEVMANIDYFSNYCKSKKTNLNFSICPMVNNWREIPDLVQFANDHKALIYFNTVFYPEELSIKALESEEINNVYMQLSKAKLPASSTFEEKNNKHYNDFLMLLKGWSNEAIIREEKILVEQKQRENEERVIKNSSVDALLILLFNKIEEAVQDSTLIEQNQKYEVTEKLKHKARKAAYNQDDEYKVKMAIYMITNLTRPNRLILLIEELSDDELNARLKQYIENRVN